MAVLIGILMAELSVAKMGGDISLHDGHAIIEQTFGTLNNIENYELVALMQNSIRMQIAALVSAARTFATATFPVEERLCYGRVGHLGRIQQEAPHLFAECGGTRWLAAIMPSTTALVSAQRPHTSIVLAMHTIAIPGHFVQ